MFIKCLKVCSPILAKKNYMEKEGKRKTTKTICKLILFNNAFMMERNDISLFGLFATLKSAGPNLTELKALYFQSVAN